MLSTTVSRLIFGIYLFIYFDSSKTILAGYQHFPSTSALAFFYSDECILNFSYEVVLVVVLAVGTP